MGPEASAQPALHEIWQALVTDAERLRLVASDAIAALEEERFPLVLSDRKDHLELLLAEIAAASKHAAGFLFTSDIGKRQRNRMMDEIRAMRKRGEFPFLLSTGSLIGEGFDLPELCTLVLAMPLSSRVASYSTPGVFTAKAPASRTFASTTTSKPILAFASRCSERG